jgi:hypothetical protein
VVRTTTMEHCRGYGPRPRNRNADQARHQHHQHHQHHSSPFEMTGSAARPEDIRLPDNIRLLEDGWLPDNIRPAEGIQMGEDVGLGGLG